MTAPAELAAAVAAGSRAALARAVTLVESTREDHRAQAAELLRLLPTDPARTSIRVGISGIPGVGKSTLIETLGRRLLAAGHRLGVLAVDPSSVRTGGSVLGDKTRMPELAADERAFVRPSPTAGTLGGVASATAHAITLVEAAGYDVVLVETVGVGQSEVAVADLVDTVLLLGLAGTGDGLQGIKRGVLELADIVAVTKADGDGAEPAQAAAGELTGALRLLRPATPEWTVPVLTCSALTGDGVDALWRAVLDHRGARGPQRLREHRAAGVWQLARRLFRDDYERRIAEAVAPVVPTVRADVLAGRITAADAAETLRAAMESGLGPEMASTRQPEPPRTGPAG